MPYGDLAVGSSSPGVVYTKSDYGLGGTTIKAARPKVQKTSSRPTSGVSGFYQDAILRGLSTTDKSKSKGAKLLKGVVDTVASVVPIGGVSARVPTASVIVPSTVAGGDVKEAGLEAINRVGLESLAGWFSNDVEPQTTTVQSQDNTPMLLAIGAVVLIGGYLAVRG